MQERVYKTAVRDTSDLKQRLTDTWANVSQNIIDEDVDQWRKRLRAGTWIMGSLGVLTP